MKVGIIGLGLIGGSISLKLKEVNNGITIYGFDKNNQPPAQVLEAIQGSLNDVSAHKYQSYQGLPELRNAISDFYKNKFDVASNPENEVLPLMGSKEGIMHISMAFLNEGDKVLIPNPGYPTYTSVTKLVGAEPLFYNLSDANNWQPNYKELEEQDLSDVKIMWVNLSAYANRYECNFRNI